MLEYLKLGRRITQRKAALSMGCWRLAPVIKRLRDEGHKIDTEMVKPVDGGTYARYTMAIDIKALFAELMEVE